MDGLFTSARAMAPFAAGRLKAHWVCASFGFQLHHPQRAFRTFNSFL
jgi:hypothetical protein